MIASESKQAADVDQFRSAPTIRSSIDADLLRRLARGAIPALADFCLIYLATGSHIFCVASAHATSDGTRLVRALARAYHVRRTDRGSTVAEVVRLARPIHENLRNGVHLFGAHGNGDESDLLDASGLQLVEHKHDVLVGNGAISAHEQ